MDRFRDVRKSLEEGEKGHFTLENDDGMALLTVYPPSGGGEMVRLTDVMARLELFGIEGFDKDEIREIVENASGSPRRIGPWVEPDPVDAKATVQISEDEMEAWVEIVPPRFGGNLLTPANLEEILKKEGVVWGLIRDALEDLSLSRHNQRLTVARGREPSEGSPGSIVHYFYSPSGVMDLKEEGGRVDFREIQVIRSAKEGDLLSMVQDPSPGVVGKTVTGIDIPCKEPVVAELHAGKNTQLSDDKKKIIASITGQVRVRGPRPDLEAIVEMEPILELETVDYSTGHVDFPGSVVIRGRVADGFRVKAAGDLQVEKSVGSVRLESGGDILLAGGIVSRGGGYIAAARSIYAKFVENATLNAGSGIYIEEASMHSRLTAGERIIVDGGRGEIIGGIVVTALELVARKIGARAGSPTRINAGLDPKTLDRLRDLDSEYEDRLTTLRKVEVHILQIEESRRRGRELSLEEVENLEKLIKVRDKLTQHLSNLESQREKVYSMIQPDPDATVIARDGVYQGVEISFGAGVRKYRIEGRPIDRYSRFILEKDSIVLRHSDL